MDNLAGARPHRERVWVKHHPAHVADLARDRWSCQRPAKRALERDEGEIERWRKKRWPKLKKSPKRGSNDSLCGRERAERKAPLLSDLVSQGANSHFAIPLYWKHLSAIAGVTWRNFYYCLFPGSIRSAEVMEFLKHLLRLSGARCWSSGTGSEATGAGWSTILSLGNEAGCRLSLFRLMPLSSTRWSICGVTGNNMSYPTSVRKTFSSLATKPEKLCAACAGVRLWSLRSGDKLNCFNVTIICKPQ